MKKVMDNMLYWLVLLSTRLTSTQFLEIDNAEKNSSKPRETKFKQNSNWSPILDLYIVHVLQRVIFLLFGTKTWENFGDFFNVNFINFAPKKNN